MSMRISTSSSAMRWAASQLDSSRIGTMRSNAASSRLRYASLAGGDGAERAQRLGPRFERHPVDVERLVAAVRAIQHIGEDVEQAQMVDGEILARLPERFQRRVGGGDRVVATVQGAHDQSEIGVA